MDMRFEDHLIAAAMMLSVVRQLRGRPLTWLGLAWPVVLVGYAGLRYLGQIQLAGNNVLLMLVLAVTGLALGLVCGVLSRVSVGTPGAGRVMVRTTGLAATLWVAGIGVRILFALVLEHGGLAAVVHLDNRWHITSLATWSTGLLLMSLLEVGGRTVILGARLHAARPVNPLPGAAS